MKNMYKEFITKWALVRGTISKSFPITTGGYLGICSNSSVACDCDGWAY